MNSAPVILGFDVGGTKFMVAAADGEGTILKSLRAPTSRSLAEGLTLLKAMGRECAGIASVTSIGASAGGPLEWRTGVVSPLHQPEWREVPSRQSWNRNWGAQCSSTWTRTSLRSANGRRACGFHDASFNSRSAPGWAAASS